MKEKTGQVFSIAKDHTPVTGCTISKAVHSGENAIIYFSLAENTDISAEIFPYYKLLIVAEGMLEVYEDSGRTTKLQMGESIVTPADVPVGMRTKTGAVYTEIENRYYESGNKSRRGFQTRRIGTLPGGRNCKYGCCTQ